MTGVLAQWQNRSRWKDTASTAITANTTILRSAIMSRWKPKLFSRAACQQVLSLLFTPLFSSSVCPSTLLPCWCLCIASVRENQLWSTCWTWPVPTCSSACFFPSRLPTTTMATTGSMAPSCAGLSQQLSIATCIALSCSLCVSALTASWLWFTQWTLWRGAALKRPQLCVLPCGCWPWVEYLLSWSPDRPSICQTWASPPATTCRMWNTYKLTIFTSSQSTPACFSSSLSSSLSSVTCELFRLWLRPMWRTAPRRLEP